MLGNFRLVLVRKTFHFFAKEGILRVDFLVSFVDFQGFLDFFLHVVTVLFKLGNDLLLSFRAVFGLLRMLLEFVLEVGDFLLVRFDHLRHIRLLMWFMTRSLSL